MTSDGYGYLRVDDNIFLRYGFWPADNSCYRGSIMVLHGRRDFLEKYDETVRKLTLRGFDVYSFDWRGQGLSTRLLPNRHKGHIKTFEDYIQDLSCVIRHVVIEHQARLPLFILAHSMGANIALRYIHDCPDVVSKAVLVAPMIDIVTFPFPRWFVRCLARIRIKTGHEDAWVPGSGGGCPGHRFEGNRMTSDRLRFMKEKTVILQNPALAVYGVTYAWLQAGLDSIDILRRRGYAKAIQVPVLVAGAEHDKIVSVRAQKLLCAGSRYLTFVEIPGARHEILRETDSIQQVFWNEFDSFID
ncbi:MAG: alpha/beta hydrolase [Desulfobacterales bacterium]|nr:alpha/beta hydrolase [Desulfobacterales bacterium]MDD4072725.1 alpha/beta hydrolase [Desulfobacterales bacterium]MDD4392292.1 alpha/beta hydrolase [Desulfobacterales bacterium]